MGAAPDGVLDTNVDLLVTPREYVRFLLSVLVGRSSRGDDAARSGRFGNGFGYPKVLQAVACRDQWFGFAADDRGKVRDLFGKRILAVRGGPVQLDRFSVFLSALSAGF